MSAPLVSTIIPVLDRASLLREAVRSVLAQSWRPLEILIVDNGSTDDTLEQAEAFAHEHPDEVRVLHCAERGPGAAREVGRLAARGDYVQYLDSDDLLLPEKFTAQVNGLEAAPECGISYGATRFRAADGTLRDGAWKRTGEVIETLFPAMLLERWWDTSTPLYRRAVVDRGGPWLNLGNEEDWEYDCRIAAQGVRLHRVAAFVSETRDHPGPRLNRDGGRDPEKLASRARAHERILAHARRAGIGEDSAEMRHFSRALFLLARQCGAAGLAQESAALFERARDAAGVRGRALDFGAYALLARLVGWRAAGRLSQRLDVVRSRLRPAAVS